jgi:hypothetical protein
MKMNNDLNSKAINKLPDVSTLSKLLNEFDNNLIKCSSYIEIANAYKEIDFVPFYIQEFSFLDFEFLQFYRARKDIDEKINPLILSSTYSYPYSYFCKENNRANIANYPVFYAGDNIGTAILETRPGNDIDYIITKWKFIPSRNVRFASFFHSNTRIDNKWKHFLDDSEINKENDYRKLFPNKALQINLLTDYWAEKFLFEEPPYKATSHLAHSLIYIMELIDFIVYPSRANNHLSTNFAFHPNFVDKFGSIEHAVGLNLKKKGENIYNFDFNKIAEINFNSINWRQFKDSDYRETVKNFNLIYK